MNRKRKKILPEPVIANIESLSHEGRGITRVDGKILFADGALPDETVKIKYQARRSRFDEGVVQEVLKPSIYRIEPECSYFGICGGCSLQHVHSDFQIRHKQGVLMEQFSHIGKIEPREVLTPLSTSPWGYRRKARLGVKHVYNKDKVLVGFREKGKSYIADIEECKILHPNIGNKISDLKSLLDGLSIKDSIPQIEVAVGENQTVIVIRHMSEFTAADRELLLEFSNSQSITIYLQAGGPDTVQPLQTDEPPPLVYRLSKFGIDIEFGPMDFTQINFGINELMIDRVIDLLQAGQGDTVLDLFCGLGNFTLPIATRVGYVIGVEGSASLVQKAKQNAEKNRIDNVDFICRDLYASEINTQFTTNSYNKILLDPPRSGAREILEQMDLAGVARVIYVSCNPATLARDAQLLNQHGFNLDKAGVMDMFPHTTHVESLAVFDRK
jgi:23S rRNA (uracil1939-C5)-methyltransferase